jgi:hypothetical protein
MFVPVRKARAPRSMPPDERANVNRKSRMSAARTNEDGFCRRDGIPEGEIRVTVTAKGYALAQQNVVVIAGRTSNVEVVLVAGAASSGSERKVK